MDNVKNYAKETARSKYDGVADDSADGPTFEQLMDQVGPYARCRYTSCLYAILIFSQNPRQHQSRGLGKDKGIPRDYN